jgi:hypothetical protein
LTSALNPGRVISVPLSEAVEDPSAVPAGTTASRCLACGEIRLHYPGSPLDPWKKHFDYCGDEPEEETGPSFTSPHRRQQCPHCGDPATARLSIHYRYPRPEPEPEAADPWHVQGAAPRVTCGSPGCEAAAVLAARQDTTARIRRDAGEEAAAGLEWAVVRPEDVTITQQGDSAVWMSWPEPPQQAW